VTAVLAQPTETTRYTLALMKGRGLIGETRALLRAWQPGETEQSLAHRALTEDLLGRATAKRVRDIVRVFARRLLVPTAEPARNLKPLAEAASGPKRVLEDLLWYYTARADPLIWDFTLAKYWPAAERGIDTLSNTGVMEFMWEAEQDGRIVHRWTPELRRDLAGRLMGVLTDFGLLDVLKPSVRRITSFRPVDGAVIYIAHLLHAQGVPDGLIASQTAWSIFGLPEPAVWARLDQLSGEGWLVIQRAGRVARITWRHQSPEEVIGELIAAR
jgi:hypothetical protein